jgi:hypothetical protein
MLSIGGHASLIEVLNAPILLPLRTQSSAQPLPSATPEPPSTVAPLATWLRWESLGEASPG